MVILQARQRATGQTLEQARAHILAAGEFGLLVDGANRYLVVGDGVRTVGQLVDAEEFFVFKKDLP